MPAHGSKTDLECVEADLRTVEEPRVAGQKPFELLGTVDILCPNCLLN